MTLNPPLRSAFSIKLPESDGSGFDINRGLVSVTSTDDMLELTYRSYANVSSPSVAFQDAFRFVDDDRHRWIEVVQHANEVANAETAMRVIRVFFESLVCMPFDLRHPWDYPEPQEYAVERVVLKKPYYVNWWHSGDAEFKKADPEPEVVDVTDTDAAAGTPAVAVVAPGTSWETPIVPQMPLGHVS